MNRHWLFLALVAIPLQAAYAQTSTPVTGESTASADKWRCTLFNPTPKSQMRDMETDRPDKTDGPLTIDAGHLQIETGIFDYIYYRNTSGQANTRSESLALGQFNFRLGILNNLELDTIVNAIDFQRSTDYTANQSVRQNGFGDTILGGKLNLWGDEIGDDAWDTAFGFIPQFKVPTARENIGNGHPEFFLGIPLLLNFPAGFHLAMESTISCERNSQNTGYVAGWQNSASLDRTLFANFDFYVEYWSHVSSESHQETQQTLDVGVTYPLNDNVVLDTGANFGLNHASNTFEWVAGFSVRI